MSHPNPAEICRERGWKARTADGRGTKVIGCNVEFEVVYIGRDYIHTEDNSGNPYTFRSASDITAWTEIKPKPAVDIRPNGTWGLRVCVGDEPKYFASIWIHADVPSPEELRVIRRMAEAGKDAAENPEPAQAAIEGPYRVVDARDTDYQVISPSDELAISILGYQTAHDAFGFDVIDEINRRKAREIADELSARLAAKQQEAAR